MEIKSEMGIQLNVDRKLENRIWMELFGFRMDSPKTKVCQRYHPGFILKMKTFNPKTKVCQCYHPGFILKMESCKVDSPKKTKVCQCYHPGFTLKMKTLPPNYMITPSKILPVTFKKRQYAFKCVEVSFRLTTSSMPKHAHKGCSLQDLLLCYAKKQQRLR